MKHIHTQLLLLTALLSTSALADDAAVEPGPPVPEGRRNLLGISVLPLLGSGIVAVEGERVVGPRLSVGLRLRSGVTHSESQVDTLVEGSFVQESGQSSFLLGAEPMARVFLTGTAPEGLWVSPRLGVARQWGKSETEQQPMSSRSDVQSWSVSGAALLGYSAIVGRGLAVQFGAGLEARYSRNTIHSRLPVLGTAGDFVEQEFLDRSWSLGERVDVSVGWAF